MARAYQSPLYIVLLKNVGWFDTKTHTQQGRVPLEVKKFFSFFGQFSTGHTLASYATGSIHTRWAKRSRYLNFLDLFLLHNLQLAMVWPWTRPEPWFEKLPDEQSPYASYTQSINIFPQKLCWLEALKVKWFLSPQSKIWAFWILTLTSGQTMTTT